ncbi:hypothetical protein LEP1GSC103_3016 [Leptospira borgpetersenii serovar Javanica str. UI 09931]|uniref:Uncharacterized protein n=5 Tax=Leptospira borgpetersenii TaxID=174 RepID=M3HKE6_LEPBO|nr:hypothetical protein LEP1GSC128_3070 [Leptospira borgpetersenii str. 200801926]EKQ91868.1 hypothetical protein LEP1GSC101_3354 [Leptospira borgpetersenii str. UI 09149]EKR01945.1 hypothetical protein LEP1GSC121_4002 [Leptospira borgpetersenii serovar Castellonis str. 200801910]EMF98535.1 hypothetical protein LEP1GSC123_4400 [Leptospira borgpetersenii str. 200701203]EMK08315.1 hypothetical protein LEP1GSC066_1285 [Leptospira sp. serovar Kenya str. Sh9]EMN14239.1 hypothetical protein LEP1GSC0
MFNSKLALNVSFLLSDSVFNTFDDSKKPSKKFLVLYAVCIQSFSMFQNLNSTP